MSIIAAADGSALGNPGPAGWAWYVDDERWAEYGPGAVGVGWDLGLRVRHGRGQTQIAFQHTPPAVAAPAVVEWQRPAPGVVPAGAV